MKLVNDFDNILEKISRSGLVLSFFLILTLAITSILLRWLGLSLNWIDPLVRHLVFLTAFLGGSVATKAHLHIKIDLFTKLIERSDSKLLLWLHRNLIASFSLLTTLFLLKSSWDFFLVEKEFGSPALLGLHSSWPVAIIPFGIGLISLRFLNQLLLGSRAGVSR